MDISFKHIGIRIGEDGVPALTKWGSHTFDGDLALRMPVEVQILGEYKNSWYAQKMIMSSSTDQWRYVSHKAEGNALTITQRTDLIEARLVFDTFDGTDTLRVHTEITNISDRAYRVEDVSTLVLRDIGGEMPDLSKMYLHRFFQGHHFECRPRRNSFDDLGMMNGGAIGKYHSTQMKIGHTNVGSWSTKEALPQAIIEDERAGTFLMFQMESNHSWHYEISDYGPRLYLYLGGANRTNCAWSKVFKPGESYATLPAAIALSDTLSGVIGEMSKYRRHISGLSQSDRSLPIIFNEYMHFAWDGACEKNTRIMAPVAAAMGADYYVIDSCWHNDEDASMIHRYLGHWRESKTRFPNGVKATLDYIRSLGMKPGLWIEPEVVSIECEKDIRDEYYTDDCYLQRDGVRIGVKRKNFLDYRHPKVISYLNEVIRRMVEDYGAEYIKFDYNADLGIGCDGGADSLGDGLEQQSKAFLDWIDSIRKKYPHVILEGCASGGMRLDYASMARFSLASTSDQIEYDLYPYLAANISAAVLPEQAAVWSYPVERHPGGETGGNETDPNNGDRVPTRDSVIINMVNSLLGRMHLASRLNELDEAKRTLVAEGVAYYRTFSDVKVRALPYFPEGFARLGQDHLASGLVDGDKIYLAVWYLHGESAFTVKMPDAIKDVKIGYPSEADTAVSFTEREISLSFTGKEGAVFLEITKK